MTVARRPLGTVVVPVISAVVVTSLAVITTATDLPGLAGVTASVALAIAALRGRHEPRLLGGVVTPLAVAVGLLAACAAGTLPESGAHAWRPALAVAAYPFLGHALLKLVGQHRQVREVDVIVEAALVGTAVGILLHVAVRGWRVSSLTTGWGDAAGAFPAVLVALDVAVIVVAARSLRISAARRGPLGCMHVGLIGLLAAHLLQETAARSDRGIDSAVGALVAVALVALALAALHPAARTEPQLLLAEPPPFSASHASLVVVALLAAPGVLALQAARGVTPSPTVATGAVLSGMILAGYLVQLLHDRGITEHDATHDGLTALPNRTLLVDRLERSITHARRSGRAVGVLFIDLDRFKEVNDTFGHAAGDGLLQRVAQRLSTCVRQEDTVARLSGDEFVVLLPHLAAPEEVMLVAERVLDAFGEPMTVAGERMLITGSVGVAVFPNDGGAAEEVLAAADAAMYRAKEVSGCSWEIHSPKLAQQAQSRLQVESGLLDAIANDELVLHYQPVVDAATGLTAGAEALVRWNHPERGLLMPGEFVPIAERTDLIVMLGEKVIFDACAELRRWQDLGFTTQTIAVNVAARHFTHDLVSTVTAALRHTGANPENLVIELTESTVVENIDSVAGILEELRAMGVRSAIDDFGTGYCGLRYLSVLPVAALKIDRSFIQGMTPSDAAIVAATIAMGHSLGLRIIAEGVETPEQHRFLADQSCDRIQGYLFARPMPAADMEARLRAERVGGAAALPSVPGLATIGGDDPMGDVLTAV